MRITRRHFVVLTLGAATTTLGAAPSFAGSDIRKGTLSGRQGYNVSGTVKVKKKDGKTVVHLAEDYVFDPSKNPPDIKIGFGSGETYAKGSKIHDKLTVKKGAASFDVPAGLDIDAYYEFYIYCEQFSVILGVAPLK